MDEATVARVSREEAEEAAVLTLLRWLAFDSRSDGALPAPAVGAAAWMAVAEAARTASIDAKGR